MENMLAHRILGRAEGAESKWSLTSRNDSLQSHHGVAGFAKIRRRQKREAAATAVVQLCSHRNEMC